MKRLKTHSDRGSATIELAAGLPILMLFLGAALTAIMAVTAHLRCVDAAREAARAQARGDTGVMAGRRVAPDATITVEEDGEFVRAHVRIPVTPFGGHLPALTATAAAVAAREPGELP